MKYSTEDYKKITCAINNIRKDNEGQILNPEELRSLCRLIPNMTNRPKILAKYGILDSNKKKYVYPAVPIYWEKVKNAIMEGKQLDKIKNYKYRNKEASVNITDVLKQNKISEDDLARYLIKSGRYKVCKRIESWEEVK